MNKISKSPMLVALITVSMIASMAGSSSAYASSKPGASQADDQAEKEKEEQEKAAAEAQQKAAAEAARQAQQQAQQQAQEQARQQAEQQRQQQAAQQAAQQAEQQRQEQQRQAQQQAQQAAQQAAQQRAQQQQAEQQKQAQQKAEQDARDRAAQQQQQQQAQQQQEQKAKPPVQQPPSGPSQQQIDKANADAKAKADAAAQQAQQQAQQKAAQDAKAKADAAAQQAQAAKDAKAKADAAAQQAQQQAQQKAAQDAKAKADAAAQAQAQAAKDAKAKADAAAQQAQQKAAQDAKAKADAQAQANRKQPPQNPIGAPPVLKPETQDKSSVADKLKKAQSQTASQTAASQAQKDQETQKIAQAAAAASADPKAKAEQKAKEQAAAKASDDQAKQLAVQKAQAKKASQPSKPVTPKTPQQVAVQAQQKAKAKTNISSTPDAAQAKEVKEATAAAKVNASVEKKQVVTVKKEQDKVKAQSADIRQLSKNPDQAPSAAQAQKIAQNKKQIEAKQAANANKPVVVAPVHATAVVKVKTVQGGASFGLDPRRPTREVLPKNVVLKPAPMVGGVAVPSHLAFPETQNNIKTANIRSENIHNTIINRTDVTSVRITTKITNTTNIYVTNYQNVNIERSRVFNNYYYQPNHLYTGYYSSYYDHGFRGGYAYPVRLDIAIQESFWNPVVLWMFDDSDNTDFYCQYYGDDFCYSYPITPFRYARVYYPTDTMRDLAIEVSGMDYYRHTYYRQALEVMTDSLNEQISNYVDGRFYFGPNDVVINYYQNLGGGQIIVEGFVDRGDLHVSFKGHLDLENPLNSSVFVPTVSDYTQESPAQILVLAAINAIQDAADAQNGIDPNLVYQEPAPAPLPVTNVTCNTFSGDISRQGVDPDSGTAAQNAIAQCSNISGANATECTSNLSCDDGVSYAPIVSCSTSSTDINGNILSYVRNGRDADYASQMAEQICVADDAAYDLDACTSADNVTCVALDNTVINPMLCSVTVPVTAQDLSLSNQSFTSQSYDSDKARTRAISQCITADGTDVDDCNDVDNLSCDYVNAPAPPAPVVVAPTCTATGPDGVTQYSSGPATDLHSAYNQAVKACSRANPMNFGICESTAATNCPGGVQQ